MKNLWIYLCIIALILSGIHPAFYKALNKNTNDIPFVISFIFLIIGIISLLYLLLNYKLSINYIKNNYYNFKYIFILAFIIITFNYCISLALKTSPNTCICLLIINLNIIIALLVDRFFFNYKFNIPTIIGFFIAILGLCIINYYSK
jgi:drug/metabolite transporter (DMT)-like permease